uniref:Uncharacterized protein n=1 Tax=Setaria viridis TaxID=4556 RepID=A0A4V6D9S5_SETVI|nr:hypothetical protein SEVIR_3G212300v2 [Setaria viridis]
MAIVCAITIFFMKLPFHIAIRCVSFNNLMAAISVIQIGSFYCLMRLFNGKTDALRRSITPGYVLVEWTLLHARLPTRCTESLAAAPRRPSNSAKAGSLKPLSRDSCTGRQSGFWAASSRARLVILQHLLQHVQLRSTWDH